MTTHIVIMAGGQGTRLYPLSTSEKPKQFLDLLDCGRTLIQLCYDRFVALDPEAIFWVVSSERYASLVKEQLPAVPESRILCEPEPRNTAPCIAYAIWKIKARFSDANIIVTPSDAYVSCIDSFAVTLKSALAFTEANKSAVLCIGIKPESPRTEYGYIQISSRDKMQSTEYQQNIYKVSAFKEKPCLEVAKEYIKRGNYFWNAGIFVWSAAAIESELRAYAGGIASIMDELSPSLYTARETAELRRLFPKCEKISIDYAVMEKSKNVFCVPGNWPWSDLGSFASIEAITGKTIPQDIKDAQEAYQAAKNISKKV